MILPVNSSNSNINFSAGDKEKKMYYTKDTLLKNNIATNTRIAYDKLTNACTLYPAKGLKGSKNANFYEFLTMGTVPYLVGSAMLMAIFNYNKSFMPNSRWKASALGQKMALGVLFYGLMKEVSKSFITKPVKWMTGVDTQPPYAKVNYELPESIDDTDITSIEYHKVFESVEFPRWDLLYGDETKGEKRNAYYDKVAKKLGLGDNLNDSDQEVKPLIKEIVVKSNLARNISSYMWAACGVGLAFQEPWKKFFNVMCLKPWKPEQFMESTVQFGKSFCESAKSFIIKDKSHSGKILVGTAALTSLLGVINVMSSSKKPSKLDSADVIQKDRKYVVN